MQQLFFGSLGALTFLAAQLSNPLCLFAQRSQSLRLESFQQNSPREKSIERLEALFLTAHFKTARQMPEHDARGYFINVLASRTA